MPFGRMESQSKLPVPKPYPSALEPKPPKTSPNVKRTLTPSALPYNPNPGKAKLYEELQSNQWCRRRLDGCGHKAVAADLEALLGV